MARPYDVLVSREVRGFIAGLSDQQALLEFNRAIDSLLHDPTESNPQVARISQDYGYELNEFAIRWGALTLIFDFADSHTVEILAAYLFPQPRDE